MTIARSEAHGEVMARAASPAGVFFRRLRGSASVVRSMSVETFSGIAIGSRVLTAQASLRIWTML